jgi:hypothetical protein
MRITLTLIFASITLATTTQAQFVKNDWGRLIGGDGGTSDNLTIFDMDVDAQGNTVIVGQFYGTVDVDPSAATVEISSPNVNFLGGFMAKYTSAGNLIWAKAITGNNSVVSIDQLAIDAAGNLYVSGNPGGTSDLDPGAGTFNLAVGSNWFMAKYDADGNFVWGTGSSAASQFRVVSLFINDNNELVELSVSPQAATARYSISTHNPSTGATLSSITLTGNANVMDGGAGSQLFKGVQDADGDYLVTGAFSSGTFDADPGVGATVLQSNGSNQSPTMFVGKYGSDLSLQWAFALVGNGVANGGIYPAGITADAQGNVYVAGTLLDTIDFDPQSGQMDLYPATGGERGFIAKYSPEGNLIWARVIDENDNEDNFGQRSFIYDLTMSADLSQLYFVGGLWDNSKDLNIGSGTLIIPHIKNFDNLIDRFHFVANADLDGNTLNVNTHLASGLSYTTTRITRLATAPDGNIHIASNFVEQTASVNNPLSFGACLNDPYPFMVSNSYHGANFSKFIPCNNPPAISTQPQDATGCEGLPLTVNIGVSGSTCEKYHWFKQSLDNGSWEVVSDSSALHFPSFGGANAGTYICTVEGECGSVSSNIFTIGGPLTPVYLGVSDEANPLEACEATDLTLQFSNYIGNVQGSNPISYQWRTETALVATGQSASLTNLEAADAGLYYGIVTNFCNSDTVIIDLIVKPLPDATPSDLSAEFCAGESATLNGPGDASVQYTWLDGDQSGLVSGNDFNITAGGTYYLQAQQSGCTAVSAAITVTENALPAQPTITQSGADLVSSYATGNQWYLDGDIIDGAFGQTYTPIVNGNYTVVHTDVNACEAMSQAYNMLTVGIAQTSAEIISVSPNPSSGVFVVSGTGAMHCTVHDALGREVLRTATRTIDLSTSPAGVYTLTVAAVNGSTSTAKLVRN